MGTLVVAPLGLVHGSIRSDEQLFGVAGVGPKFRPPDACAHAAKMSGCLRFAVDRSFEPPRNDACRSRVCVQQDGEFVAGKPSGKITFA